MWIQSIDIYYIRNSNRKFCANLLNEFIDINRNNSYENNQYFPNPNIQSSSGVWHCYKPQSPARFLGVASAFDQLIK